MSPHLTRASVTSTNGTLFLLKPFYWGERKTRPVSPEFRQHMNSTANQPQRKKRLVENGECFEH